MGGGGWRGQWVDVGWVWVSGVFSVGVYMEECIAYSVQYTAYIQCVYYGVMHMIHYTKPTQQSVHTKRSMRCTA